MASGSCLFALIWPAISALLFVLLLQFGREQTYQIDLGIDMHCYLSGTSDTLVGLRRTVPGRISRTVSGDDSIPYLDLASSTPLATFAGAATYTHLRAIQSNLSIPEAANKFGSLEK